MPPRKTAAPSDHKAKGGARRATAAFDLDALEREGEDIKPPFKFKHGGKVFTLSDPAEIDLSEIVEIGTNPSGEAGLLANLMGDQYEDIVNAGKLPQWKLGPMLQAWYDHYGLEPGKSRG
ncbi:MAG TPA: hypothetical protein VK611_26925 [Acidimicrobiales bacterium]|nr:hypothetical protein [Acidimicrobiales bacterium]